MKWFVGLMLLFALVGCAASTMPVAEASPPPTPADEFLSQVTQWKTDGETLAAFKEMDISDEEDQRLAVLACQYAQVCQRCSTAVVLISRLDELIGPPTEGTADNRSTLASAVLPLMKLRATKAQDLIEALTAIKEQHEKQEQQRRGI